MKTLDSLGIRYIYGIQIHLHVKTPTHKMIEYSTFFLNERNWSLGWQITSVCLDCPGVSIEVSEFQKTLKHLTPTRFPRASYPLSIKETVRKSKNQV